MTTEPESTPEANAPDVEIRQQGAATGDASPWGVSFQITNRGAGPVELIDARIPHPKYRAGLEPHALDGKQLASGEGATLEFSVAFTEAPGDVAENTFVLLRVTWGGQTWRVLQRFTVTSGARGEPIAANENMSAHLVGFAD